MGPLNCGTWYMEALPVPQYPGLWVGDKPQWVEGSLYSALEYCQIPDTGAYSEAFGFAWDALRIP